MSPERERQILGFVGEALARSPKSRNAFLRDKIGDDALALAEAHSLLALQSRGEMLESTLTLRGFAPEEIIGERFRIVRFIGHGGMGDVYEAEDMAHTRHRHVALKTIRPEIASNKEIVEQFQQEIELGQAITHPNVCRVYDLGLHVEKAENIAGSDNRPTLFVTMELLNGHTLSEHIRGSAPMAPSEALPMIRQMADALHAAHELNIIHRDFKPANVILVPSRTSPGTRAVVTDFGLAVEISGADGVTPLSAIRGGTPDYMSPEQARGHAVDRRSDIYALGVVAYEMVTGQFPFDGQSSHIRMVKRLHEPPVPPNDRIAGFNALWSVAILGCLEREPQKRFPTAIDFVRILESKSSLAAPDVSSGHSQRVAPDIKSPDHAGPDVKDISGRERTRRTFLVIGVLLAVIFTCFILFYRAPLATWLYPLPREKRVAILRFENIGGDSSNQAFCDGLMQSLASRLTQLERFQGALSIIPASDVRKAQITSAREAKREFDATLAITGSVERSAGRVHLIVNVVDTREVKQLRSRDIFVNQTDALAMQEDVVRDVADLLDLQLRPQVIKQLNQGSTAVPGAYDFYLQGSGYLLSGRNGIDHAIIEFKHALELDPHYAFAYAGLGEAYWAKYLATKDRTWIDSAWKQCVKAIDLTADIAPPHVTLAMLNSGTGHYEEATRQAQSAMKIDPTSYQAYSELARALEATGRFEEAEATLKRAIELKPSYWNNYLRLATFYFNRGRYRDAEPQYHRVIELVPDNPAGYTNLGVIYHMEGREAEAEQLLKQSLDVRHTPQAASNLATVYFFEGRYGDAIPILEKLVLSGTKDYLIWGNLGDAYRWTRGNEGKAHRAYDTAITFTEQALEVNSRDIRALSAQALYRAKIGQNDLALAGLRRVVAESPNDPDVLFDAAVICEIAGKRLTALDFVAKAIRAGYSLNEITADPELRGLRGDLHYAAAVGPIREAPSSGKNR